MDSKIKQTRCVDNNSLTLNTVFHRHLNKYSLKAVYLSLISLMIFGGIQVNREHPCLYMNSMNGKYVAYNDKKCTNVCIEDKVKVIKNEVKVYKNETNMVCLKANKICCKNVCIEDHINEVVKVCIEDKIKVTGVNLMVYMIIVKEYLHDLIYILI